MEVIANQETAADRLTRMPNVLRAYAKDAAKGIVSDSGLAEILTFAAESIERLNTANCNTSVLTWTSAKPRTQGCYWLRMSGCAGGVEIVKVKADPSSKELYLHEHGDKRHYKLSGYADGCEWYGPITEPEAAPVRAVGEGR